MPSVQRGSVFKLAGGQWAYRLASDEHGERRQVGGFKTKGEARAACDRHVARVLDPFTVTHRDPTLAELVDDYLDQHQADPATIAKLRRQFRQATAAFGERKLSELHARDRYVRRSNRRSAGTGWTRTPPGSSRTRSRDGPRSSRSSPGPRSRPSPPSSTHASPPSRSSPPAPACAPRSGPRLSGAISTGGRASSTFAASTRRAA